MKKKPFYGWWIVAVGALIMAFTHTLVMSCAGLFLTPVTQEMGFARGSYTLCNTIVALTTMVMSPFMGRAFTRYETKRVIGICVAGVSLSLMSYSLAQSLWQFYLSAFGIGLFYSGSTLIPVSFMVTNWFVKKRSFAMSLCMAGSGVGGAVLSPLINFFILNVGWRNTYLIMGGLILTIVLPSILLIVRKFPEDMGLKPYGSEEINVEEYRKHEGLGVTLSQVKRYPMFWLFLLALSISNMLSGGMFQNLPSYIQDIGYSSTTASILASAYLAVSIPGKIISGRIFDRFGPQAGALFGGISYLLTAIFLLLIFNGPAFLMVPIALFHGLSTCLATIVPPSLTGKIFGTMDYARIFSVVNLALNLGSSVGTPLFATLYDTTGSYIPAWILCLIGSILFMSIVSYCVQKSKKMKVAVQP